MRKRNAPASLRILLCVTIALSLESVSKKTTDPKGFVMENNNHRTSYQPNSEELPNDRKYRVKTAAENFIKNCSFSHCSIAGLALKVNNSARPGNT